jgi:hypothetical protein
VTCIIAGRGQLCCHRFLPQYAAIAYDKHGATEYCATTVRHMERLQSERRLAYHTVGGKGPILESDLDAFLDGGRMEALR